MLGKMLAHGLVAAIIVGSGAALYATTRGNTQMTVPALTEIIFAHNQDD